MSGDTCLLTQAVTQGAPRVATETPAAGEIAAAGIYGALTHARSCATCFPESPSCTQNPLRDRSPYNPFRAAGETEAPSSSETR